MQNSGFLSFFGLRENPFNVNLDPRFLFVTPHLEKVFSEVMDGIQSGNSFAVITGEVGTGKTTLMHRLRRRLQQQGTPTAFIFYTHLDRTHLLDFILSSFGIPLHSGETIDAWKRLENWLMERNLVGQTPVLLVDEAQGLPFRGFEEIRMLLNLETPRKKLMQVVLAGQPELEEKLKRVQMRELQQRITAHCKTAKLNRDETSEYVRNRLKVGGAADRVVFDWDAMDAIYLYSHGIPRIINILCERALIGAYTSQDPTVAPHFIEQIARSFQWEKAGPMPASERPVSIASENSVRMPPIVAAVPLDVPEEAVMNGHASDSRMPDMALAPAAASEEFSDARGGAPAPAPPTALVRQSQQSVTARASSQRLIVFSERANKKAQPPELTHSAARQLLAEFIQELENQNMLRNAQEQENIRPRETMRYALRRLVEGPLGAWWLYGERVQWRKRIGSVMDLPRWRCRSAALQRWLNEPVRPFQWGLANPRAGNAQSSDKAH